MEYKGYTIDHDRGHYLVTGPEGRWTEDTVEDAKAAIDEAENMGSVGNTTYMPGSIRTHWDTDLLGEAEKQLLLKDKDFNFDIHKGVSTVISIKDNTGYEVATASLWYDEVEVHNRMTGAEVPYKNLQSALSAIRRQYKNRRK